MDMTRIVVHIDRIVLTGLDADFGDAFRAALEHALVEQLNQPGVASALSEQPRRARLSAPATPARDARATADAVTRVLVTGAGHE